MSYQLYFPCISPVFPQKTMPYPYFANATTLDEYYKQLRVTEQCSMQTNRQLAQTNMQTSLIHSCNKKRGRNASVAKNKEDIKD